MSKKDLGEALSFLPALPESLRANLLVGTDSHDDAAVYQLAPGVGLVATVDVFAPIVDDPGDFGRIAAANSLSDVYAMGGVPLFALSVVGFPVSALPISDLGAILAGAAEVAAEAGTGIVGGHSIDDPEPKFGLCVIGQVDPARMTRNDGGRAGDLLVLTKPIGTGVIASAIKRECVDPAVAAGAVASMCQLNRVAAEAMVSVGASAATDVTGFGLAGHLHELVHGSGLAATLYAGSVPLLAGARDLVESGVVPGGTRRNLAYFNKWISWEAGISEGTQLLLADAQTSGGLLVALAAGQLEAFRSKLPVDGSVACAVIGTLRAGPPGEINIVSGAYA